MQGFFSQHWEISLAIFNLLIGAVVFLASALARMQFKHIDSHQGLQDREIKALTSDVSNLKGDGKELREIGKGLDKTLEHYLETLGQRLDEYQRVNEVAHGEIKSDVQSLVRAIKAT